MKEHAKHRSLSYYTIKRLLAKGTPFDLKIDGTSMEPYLKIGDYVRIQCGDRNFEEGELVLIDWGDTFVIHRLINRQNMLTKGDNLNTVDPLGLKIVCTAKKVADSINIEAM